MQKKEATLCIFYLQNTVGTDEDTTNMLYMLVINQLKREGIIIEDSIFINSINKKNVKLV